MSTDSPVILAATDLTEASHSVVEFTAKLAAAIGARVELVHVMDMAGQEPVAKEADEAIKPYLEKLRERNRQRLDQASSKLEAERRKCEQVGAACEARLLEGRVWESLLEHATRIETDFIVVGPHGLDAREVLLGAIRERLLGSTADRLVRHARCPVWVVPPDLSEVSFSQWTAAVDFSASSTDAVALAKTLAAKTGGQLALLHVMPPSYWAAEEEPHTWQDALRHATRTEAEKKLQKLAEDAPGVEVLPHVIPGESRLYADLLREAKNLEASVLVVGSHGRSGLGHLVLGSTAERCLRRAAIPVLVVRGQAQAEN